MISRRAFRIWVDPSSSIGDPRSERCRATWTQQERDMAQHGIEWSFRGTPIALNSVRCAEHNTLGTLAWATLAPQRVEMRDHRAEVEWWVADADDRRELGAC